MAEELSYRDGHEGDIDPVLIDRRGDGSVRVVVRYPRQVKIRTRNRLIYAVHFFILWHLMLYWLIRAFPRSSVAVLGSLWLPWVLVVGVLAVVWWRTKWLYVFEARPDALAFETQGVLFTRRRRYPRELVTDVSIGRGYHDKPDCLWIMTPRRHLTRRFLDFLGEQHLVDIETALREGLEMRQTLEAR